MIGKGKSRANAEQLFKYLDKENSEFISRNNMIGESPSAKAKEMQRLQAYNSKCKKNIVHFQLSPHSKDKLTKEQWRELGTKFLSKMELSKNQYEMVLHKDTKTPHLHIVVNRVNEQGKAWNDSHSVLKSIRIADEVAKEMNLTRAKEVKQRNENNKAWCRQKFRESHKQIMAQHKAPTTFAEWSKQMQRKGLEIQPVRRQGGAKEIYAFRVNVDGNSYKSSSLDRKVRYADIVKECENAKTQNIINERERRAEQERERQQERERERIAELERERRAEQEKESRAEKEKMNNIARQIAEKERELRQQREERGKSRGRGR